MKMQPAKGLPNFFIPKWKLLELLEKSSDFDLNIVIRPDLFDRHVMEIRTLNGKTNEVVAMDIPEETR